MSALCDNITMNQAVQNAIELYLKNKRSAVANLTHSAEVNALFLPVETIPVKKMMNDYNYIIKIIIKIAANVDRYCVCGFYTILHYYAIYM